MYDSYTWYVVAIIAFVTASLRFLPFVIFNGDKKTPKIIEKLSNALPYAIMGMLVVYCLKDINFTNVDGYLPATISCLLVSILYIWKRNTLTSIVAGTICYMFLAQMVF